MRRRELALGERLSSATHASLILRSRESGVSKDASRATSHSVIPGRASWREPGIHASKRAR